MILGSFRVSRLCLKSCHLHVIETFHPEWSNRISNQALYHRTQINQRKCTGIWVDVEARNKSWVMILVEILGVRLLFLKHIVSFLEQVNQGKLRVRPWLLGVRLR